MSRGAHSFKQSDVTKAVRAVEKAGKRVCRVEIADGKIVVFAGQPDATGAIEEANEWDSVK
jgi:hypothetical protein